MRVEYTRRERLRYRLERALSRGPAILIVWLVVLAAVLVALGSLLLLVLVGESVTEALWTSAVHTLDPGALNTDVGLGRRVATLTISLGGIVLVSLLIGILSNVLQDRIEVVRKGLTPVIEEDHLLILGWTDNLFAIVEQLSVAQSYRGLRESAAVVILAEREKMEMEDELATHLGEKRRHSLVCRSGNPIDLHDLALVNPSQARAVIILAPETGDADAEVIKILLALAQMGGPESQPIVAEIQQPRNLEVARLAGGPRVVLVPRQILLARILAQTSLQPGLSQAYNALLDFNGEDVQFVPSRELAGKRFADAQLGFERCSLIGLRQGDKTVLNPPPETMVGAADLLIVVARDPSCIQVTLGAARLVNHSQIAKAGAPAQRPLRRVLILGLNRNLPLLVRELDDYLAPGSEVLVAAEDLEVTPELAELKASMADVRLEFTACDTADRVALETVQPATFDNVIVLSYSDSLGYHEADARTLITLLHLRAMEAAGEAFTVVSEMQDEKNRALAAVTQVDDFIVSSRLSSLLLAQIAHNREVGPVFDDLFDSLGSEFYLRPAARYVTLGQGVCFATVVESARQSGEVALGYLLHGQALVLNPDKSSSVTFAEADRVLVLAAE